MLLILLFLEFVKSIIEPRSFKPIELSINNINEISDYNFYFYLDT